MEKKTTSWKETGKRELVDRRLNNIVTFSSTVVDVIFLTL